MKKVIICLLLVFILLICLTACNENKAAYNESKVIEIKDANTYTTFVYCSGNSTCHGCLRWPIDVSKAYHVECVNITNNIGSHQHYVVTWINKEEDNKD